MNSAGSRSIGAWTGAVFVCSLAWTGVANALPVITGGLIASYEFSGDATDTSGNGNDLTVSGATLTTDRFGIAGSAYRLDGINDYLRTNSAWMNLGANQYSINIWANYDGIRSGGSTILNSDPHEGIAIGVGDIYQNDPSRNNTAAYYVGDGLPGNWTVSGLYGVTGAKHDVSSGVWHQFTVVKDGGQWRFYIDGLLDSTLNGSVPAPLMTSLYFGAASFLDSYLPTFDALYLAGSLDDISIYNRALSDSEITILFEAQPNAVSTPATLVLMLTCVPAVVFVTRERKSVAA
jgi:Concanavalin A-like lectin/glucanases superfamily